MLDQKIKSKIENQLNKKIKTVSSLSGGCISNAYKVEFDDGSLAFAKYNPSFGNEMFRNEANGLIELNKARAIRIPNVFYFDSEIIITELINPSAKKKDFFSDFGRQFANLHKFTSENYGFYEDNFIGSNPQKNIPAEDEKNNWIKFYFNKRILYQYKLAEKNGYSNSELKNGISKLENKIEEILSGSDDKKSLLHGDLWGGNYMVDENGEACLIDPAVYYGNREADLAMTKLFGGFSSEFYRTYNETLPLPEGYDYRENIYKLYHVLNHLNLFGGGYYSQAISLIKYYL